MVSDAEILDAISLLARTEGIFTEPAGGTTLAATRVLIRQGASSRTSRSSSASR
jgi:threonine synthase